MLLGDLRLLHGRDAKAIGHLQTAAKTRDEFLGRVWGNLVDDQPRRRLAQSPRRFSGFGIALDAAARRVGGVLRDPRDFQSPRVDPRRMSVESVKYDRP